MPDRRTNLEHLVTYYDETAAEIEALIALREKGWTVLTQAQRRIVARTNCHGFKWCDDGDLNDPSVRVCRGCYAEAKQGDMTEARKTVESCRTSAAQLRDEIAKLAPPDA